MVLSHLNSLLLCAEEASPEQARARQSGRQRKQRQYGDEMWDDEMLSGAYRRYLYAFGHPSAGSTAEALQKVENVPD